MCPLTHAPWNLRMGGGGVPQSCRPPVPHFSDSSLWLWLEALPPLPLLLLEEKAPWLPCFTALPGVSPGAALCPPPAMASPVPVCPPTPPCPFSQAFGPHGGLAKLLFSDNRGGACEDRAGQRRPGPSYTSPRWNQLAFSPAPWRVWSVLPGRASRGCPETLWDIVHSRPRCAQPIPSDLGVTCLRN